MGYIDRESGDVVEVGEVESERGRGCVITLQRANRIEFDFDSTDR